MPVPVSASPPSWRTPTSSDGVNAPEPVSKLREPSTRSRTRLASACAPARFPPLPLTASELVRTQNASDLSATVSPPGSFGESTSPRSPIAPMRILMSGL